MGGKCQQEFKHEIPKVRKMDGLVGPRISWTIRSMHNKNTSTTTTTIPRSNGNGQQDPLCVVTAANRNSSAKRNLSRTGENDDELPKPVLGKRPRQNEQ